MSYVQDRIDGSTRRIDAMLNNLANREAERQRAEDAEREEARRVRMRDNAERRRQFGARYADALRLLASKCRRQSTARSTGEYRKRLYEGLRRKLPSDHSLADVDADDIPGSAARIFEQQLLEAAKLEAAKPSVENLPASGELVRRDLTDPMTGLRTINWHGRESFIKQMSRGGQKVLRIVNPRTGAILMGAPMDRAW